MNRKKTIICIILTVIFNVAISWCDLFFIRVVFSILVNAGIIVILRNENTNVIREKQKRINKLEEKRKKRDEMHKYEIEMQKCRYDVLLYAFERLNTTKDGLVEELERVKEELRELSKSYEIIEAANEQLLAELKEETNKS